MPVKLCNYIEADMVNTLHLEIDGQSVSLLRGLLIPLK